MGGGTILILFLTLFLNIDQHIAQGTNLIFFVFASVSSILINIRYKNIDYKLCLFISLFGIIGSIVGAFISKNINSGNLRKYFAIFILIIAICEIYELYKEYKKRHKTHNK